MSSERLSDADLDAILARHTVTIDEPDEDGFSLVTVDGYEDGMRCDFDNAPDRRLALADAVRTITDRTRRALGELARDAQDMGGYDAPPPALKDGVEYTETDGRKRTLKLVDGEWVDKASLSAPASLDAGRWVCSYPDEPDWYIPGGDVDLRPPNERHGWRLEGDGQTEVTAEDLEAAARIVRANQEKP